tara:strand:+ start:2528 stop:2872 length:345 start_codon:yes stop_codon:yes gene_type:complete
MKLILTPTLVQQIIKEELKKIQREEAIPAQKATPPTPSAGTGMQRSEFDKQTRGRMSGQGRQQLDSKELEMINSFTSALHAAAGKQGVSLTQSPQFKMWLQKAQAELDKIISAP